MRIILALMLCLWAVSAYAGVDAEVFYKDIDSNGNIRIWTQYTIDDSIVDSDYEFKGGKILNAGKEQIGQYTDTKLNGKQLYATRFNANNLAGMTDDQIEKRILWEAEKRAENLIQQEFVKKTVSTNQDIFANHLKNLIGKKITKTEAEIKVNDEQTLKVKADGTSVSDIAVVPDTL